MGIQRYDVTLSGKSKSGNTWRATSNNQDDVLFNIPVEEAASVRIQHEDGSMTTGLEQGGSYALAAELNVLDTDDGGKVYILHPRGAKAMTPNFDFDTLVTASVEANRRPATGSVLGAASAQVQSEDEAAEAEIPF